MNRRQAIVMSGAATAVALVASQARADTALFYNEGGVAIDGSDPVAYFTQGEPVPGSSAHTVQWMGVTWHFANAENKALFTADPVAYAPQYGGYCAWAVSQGYTASTTPEAWRIVDGKLYLNYSRRIQRRWQRDIPGNIALGDANWPSLRGS